MVRCLRGEVNREQKGCAHYDDTNFVEGVALFATGASGRERGTMKVFSLSCVYKNTIDVPFFWLLLLLLFLPQFPIGQAVTECNYIPFSLYTQSVSLVSWAKGSCAASIANDFRADSLFCWSIRQRQCSNCAASLEKCLGQCHIACELHLRHEPESSLLFTVLDCVIKARNNDVIIPKRPA